VNELAQALSAVPTGYALDLTREEGGWRAEIQRSFLGFRLGKKRVAKDVTMLGAVRASVMRP
jgi:hypothetical protein